MGRRVREGYGGREDSLRFDASYFLIYLICMLAFRLVPVCVKYTPTLAISYSSL